MLDSSQLREYRRRGVLVLPQFFSRQRVEAWYEQMRELVGGPSNGGKWAEALTDCSASDFELEPDPSPHHDLEMRALLESFASVSDWVGGNDVLARRPEPGARWTGARAPHIDFPIGRDQRDLVNTLFYLTDTRSRGGAFMYWPGSHLRAWDYFRRHPRDYGARGDYGQVEVFRRFSSELSTGPVEFTASAGDLLVWHPFLFHSASINVNTIPRIGVFGRWGTPRGRDEDYFAFERDMWSEPAWRISAAAPSVR
jgi:hypothetical protein